MAKLSANFAAGRKELETKGEFPYRLPRRAIGNAKKESGVKGLANYGCQSFVANGMRKALPKDGLPLDIQKITY